MSNIRSIRARIKSVESTRQITRSMKMVAASKLRKTQGLSQSLREYADTCAELLSSVLCDRSRSDNPYLRPSGKGRLCYVLFVGNRGLCGAYNVNVLKYLNDLVHTEGNEGFVITVGRWGRETIEAGDFELRRSFPDMSDTPTTEDARVLTDYLKALYRSGEAREIRLVYQRMRSVLSQTPECRTLLPVKAEKCEAAEFIYEPDVRSVTDALIEQYIDSTVYAALLEAKASEHSARMIAMGSATDNTDELIEKLNLKLNHERQAAVTTEIAEIAGGAEALRNQ